MYELPDSKKEILKKIAFPLMLLVVAGSFLLIWNILNLPNQDQIIEIAKGYFNKYGLVTVLISAVIEGMLLAGMYYPGSIVIFLGVMFAGDDITQVIKVVSITTLGLLTAYTIDFFIGKHGWYRLLSAFGLNDSIENAQRKLTKHASKAIFASYWHPNFAAITATSAGILRYPFGKFFFYSMLATISWNIFWGTVAYFFGEAALSFMGARLIFIVVFGMIIYKLWSKKEPPEAETKTA